MDFTFDSRVIVIGIAEPLGRRYASAMKAYGTQVVAGVSTGHGGQMLQGIPVFDMVDQAIAQCGLVETAVIFVPPYAVLDAALEAIAAGIPQLILIAEGAPLLDMVALLRKADDAETLIVGPASPGIIVPGQILLGTHPPELYRPGRIGVVSRSGTLTYEVASELTHAGLGQSVVVGIGSDRILGSSFQQWLQVLEEDEQTEAIVLIGGADGDAEEQAVYYIAEAIDKPVIAYLPGCYAAGMPTRRTGSVATVAADAARLIGLSESKVAAFQQAKIPLADRPSHVPKLVRQAILSARRG